MLDKIDIKDIIIVILVLGMIYLFYKTRHLSEKFTTPSEEIIQAVNEQYKTDIDAIRNLSELAFKILKNNDTLILPATNTTANNMKLTGNLTIDGTVTFTNKDTLALNIFPKFMVIAWASDTNIPIGWVICDGTNGTPDLRGRFILGSGVGAKDMNNVLLSNRILNASGGAETHTLTIDQIPAHTHPGIAQMANNCFRGGSCSGNRDTVWNDRSTDTGKAGGDLQGKTAPHNNMPPFWVLTYIMKL